MNVISAQSQAALVRELAPETLRQILLNAGYRAELAAAEAPVLLSATGGLGFEIRFANPMPDQLGAFADAVFQAVFRVQGELPLALVNTWNATRRFARLCLLKDALVLSMDVNVLGGVAVDHLHAQVEIWDRLVQQLVTDLREELPKLARPAPVAEPAAETPAENDA